MHNCCYPVVGGWVESHMLPSFREDSVIINRMQLFLFIFICNIQENRPWEEGSALSLSRRSAIAEGLTEDLNSSFEVHFSLH